MSIPFQNWNGVNIPSVSFILEYFISVTIYFLSSKDLSENMSKLNLFWNFHNFVIIGARDWWFYFSSTATFFKEQSAGLGTPTLDISDAIHFRRN